MNILYYFQEIGSPMFQWQRTHLIDELERHNCKVTVFNPLLFDNPEVANEKVIKVIDDGKWDLFFSNVCYYKMLFIDTLQHLKEKGIPSLSLRCDNLVIPYNDEVLAPNFDLIWLTSIETKYLYDKWGAHSFFVPYAANPFTFTYTKQPIERKVVFIGTPYGSRSIMMNTLTCGNVPIALFYGKNSDVEIDAGISVKYAIPMQSRARIIFDRLKFKEGRHMLRGVIANKFAGQMAIEENKYLFKYPSVRPCDMSQYYSKYALCLASTSTNHTDALKKPLKIVNLRNFEIPMSGGLEICKYNPELANYFEEDKEIVFYHTDEELVDKASYYMNKASDDTLFTMKKSARKRAENDHTWWKRFCIAFDILGLSYES